MSSTTISPKQLHDAVQAGQAVELIDVRTPIEFREVHVTFARNVPLDQLDSAQFAAGRNGTSQPLYVICRSGSRGKLACEKLVMAGCANVIHVEGGTQAWDQAGLPVVRGQKSISLERQVRIAVGAIVVVGTALGAFVSPYWLGLVAFFGAGQVYAAITETCAMGMLLARMPWNQVPQTMTDAATCASTSRASCCP